MRYISLLFFNIISIYICGQNTLGVNTQNPTGVFHIDGKGDNTSPITTAQATNDFIVTSTGNVGIGTTTPTSKLTLNGTLGITDVKTITNDDSEYNPQLLMKDSNSGEVITVTSTSGNTSSLNYVTYVLKNCNGDWISSFDTKIKSSDYILAIVGYSFTANDGDPIGLNAGSTGGKFVSTTVAASVSYSKTWVLAADYVGGAPPIGTNGTWTINCLLINTLIAKDLGVRGNSIENGNNTGFEWSPPMGL